MTRCTQRGAGLGGPEVSRIGCQHRLGREAGPARARLPGTPGGELTPVMGVNSLPRRPRMDDRACRRRRTHRSSTATIGLASVPRRRCRSSADAPAEDPPGGGRRIHRERLTAGPVRLHPRYWGESRPRRCERRTGLAWVRWSPVDAWAPWAPLGSAGRGSSGQRPSGRRPVGTSGDRRCPGAAGTAEPAPTQALNTTAAPRRARRRLREERCCIRRRDMRPANLTLPRRSPVGGPGEVRCSR